MTYAQHLITTDIARRTGLSLLREIAKHAVKTTMKYTHTLKSVTLKDAKSPLDS